MVIQERKELFFSSSQAVCLLFRNMLKNLRWLAGVMLLFGMVNSAHAQFDPNHSNTSSCPPNACTPGCNPGGPGGPDCTGLVCPPDPECDPNRQSCVDPNPDPPPCEGADCGDNQCGTSGNAAAGSSGALDTSTQNPINLISGNKYKRQEDLSPLPGVLGL
ncbi:MAG: hypothetical protein ACRBHB_22650, partial [Arenicella sp.]